MARWLPLTVQLSYQADEVSYGRRKIRPPIKAGQYHPSRSSNSLICVLSVRRLQFLFPDIDECAIPELAGKCVDNAECCNLPAEYVCKCRPGFEGDGQLECRGELELV